MKSILMISGIVAFMMLGACNGNRQNEHGDHDHEHHEDMQEAEGAHDHSMMEEHHGEMEREQDMHRQHESIRDNFAHQDIIILDNPYTASDADNEELKDVVKAYLQMKNALVKDNAATADKAAAKMASAVEAVDGSTLRGEGKEAWEQHASLYTNKLAEMQHVTSLEEKRSYFSHISEIVYCTVKSFGLKDDMELYATYCPMAFDNKGAYWIAETKEISNPYFGAKMMNCGEVKEEL
tara:strand:+ start:785 stop:1495 length:711 start_codon:yes stop_codon:yes gene_type:complete